MSPALRSLADTVLAGRFGAAHPSSWSPVGGGSINDAFQVYYGPHRVFAKTNSAVKFPQLFGQEKAGLDLLHACGALRTPAVIGAFETEGEQLLLLEWIAPGERTPAFWKRFGEELARQHAYTAQDFGLDTNNYMGSVPQSNRPHKDWISFFIDERLEPLRRKCSGALPSNTSALFERLYAELPGIFPEAQPPALLHGDLWSGNFLCSAEGDPVLIDPAVHFGHPAADLGLTTLFGGFDDLFYEAYHYHSPLPANHRLQWEVCNLYPLLIHLLLFGNSYLAPIRQTLQRFGR